MSDTENKERHKMWNTIACILYMINFEALQLFVVFKCVNITQRRKTCFWILFIYTLVFTVLQFRINSHLYYSDSEGMRAVSVMVHALDTFILLGIINAFSEEFLPRNFILVSFYYDFLTIIPFTNLFNKFIYRYLENSGYSTYYYAADQPAELLLISNLTIKILIIVLVSLLFNRKLKALFRKIPDSICFLVMSLFFIVLIIRIVLSVKTDFIKRNSISISLFYSDALLITILIIIIILIIIYILQNMKYKMLQKTETLMQLSYYKNVSEIYTEVRSMKHDIANHLAVISAAGTLTYDKRELYRKQLLSKCDEINHKLDTQTNWMTPEHSFISNREQYEIYNYITRLFSKRHINSAETTVSLSEPDTGTPQQLRFHTSYEKISGLKLRRIKYAATHFLIREIAKQHNCTLLFINDSRSCTVILEKSST